MVLQGVLKKGSAGYGKVVKAFGRDILQEDGEVDRAYLGQIVFSHSEKRQLLNRFGVKDDSLKDLNSYQIIVQTI